MLGKLKEEYCKECKNHCIECEVDNFVEFLKNKNFIPKSKVRSIAFNLYLHFDEKRYINYDKFLEKLDEFTTT